MVSKTQLATFEQDIENIYTYIIIIIILLLE